MNRRIRQVGGCIAVFAVTGCAGTLEAARADTATACKAPSGWEQVAAAAEHKVLVFGETHGTNEMPDAFARYVCAASAKGGRTLVLLEINTDHEAAITAASEAADPHAALLNGLPQHWSNTDGRGSRAMLGMMERLIALRQGGRDLTIAPMDQLTGWPEMESPEELSAWLAVQPPTKTQQMRDSGMAEKINAASEGFDRTIVLVGNVHARKAGLEVLPDVSLMTMLVPDAISLLVVHDGGTAWVNSGDSVGVVEQYKLNRTGLLANSMELIPEGLPAYPGDKPAYDGYVSVGAITASEPALPASN